MIADAGDRLPHQPDLRDRAETPLLDEATRLNATDLAKAAHLLAVADPEQADRDAEKELEKGDRAAHPRPVPVHRRGRRRRGPPSAAGAPSRTPTLRTALLPLTAPAPALDPDTGEDDSTPATTAPASGTP